MPRLEPFCVRLIAGLYLLKLSFAFNCPKQLHAFPPDSCVSLSEGKRSSCDSGTDGLAVLTESQLGSTGVLGHYAAAILEGDQLMWLGYRYSSSNVVQDGQGLSGTVSGSVLNSNSNFNTSASVAIGDGVCVAVDRSGDFVRRPCSQSVRWSLCQKRFTAPNASIVGPSTVSAGDNIQLTCNTAGTGVTVSWLFAADSDSVLTSVATPTFTISSFSEASHGGWYFCVATNALGSVASDPLILSTSGVVNSAMSVSLMTTPAPLTYGGTANFSCVVSGATRVIWLVNNQQASGSGTELRLASLVQDGFYHCFVRDGSGNIHVGRETVLPDPGTPGVVDFLNVETTSNSALSVQWLCPEAVGTFAPILLYYRVQYSSSSSSSDMSEVTVRASESTTNIGNCIVETSVPGLEEGTSYSIKVRAVVGGNLGQQPIVASQAATFGQAPGLIKNFEVTRPDNKTIQAKWDKLETKPPVGVIELYNVEYRQLDKTTTVNTIRNSPDQTSVTITNVVDAGLYQLRVRAGVLASTNPETFGFGNFTEWKTVGDGSSTTGGANTVSPRISGGATAGIVVACMVFVTITAVILVGVVCLAVKGWHNKSEKSEKTRQKYEPSDKEID